MVEMADTFACLWRVSSVSGSLCQWALSGLDMQADTCQIKSDLGLREEIPLIQLHYSLKYPSNHPDTCQQIRPDSSPYRTEESLHQLFVTNRPKSAKNLNDSFILSNNCTCLIMHVSLLVFLFCRCLVSTLQDLDPCSHQTEWIVSETYSWCLRYLLRCKIPVKRPVHSVTENVEVQTSLCAV